MIDYQATPHSNEAEQSVLGALLRDNNAIDRIGDLRAAHFFRHEHRAIFSEIRTQIGAGKACDVISVGVALGDRLPEGFAYLNSMTQNTPSSANISRYAELVRDRALRRGLLDATAKMIEMAQSQNGTTAAEMLDAAQSAIATLAESRVMREPNRASDVMAQHCEVMTQRDENKVSGISTGFLTIDALLNGGMNRGNLIILGARPSMGKTALSINISTNVSQEYGVLFCSQEMMEIELADRIVASLGRIDLGAVLKAKMDPQQWDRYAHAVQKASQLNLHLDEQPALTLLDVRSKARLVKRKHGLDLLVVDYLQLMAGEGDNRNQQIEEISRGLKALAKELNCVVIALSQLSRNAANKARPQLSDLRDSGAIEQDADIVMFLHRAAVDDPQSHMGNLADVFVAKNRQGRIDDVLLEYEGQYTLFRDTKAERPESPQKAARSKFMDRT
jgi:replicative DNA helicase